MESGFIYDYIIGRYVIKMKSIEWGKIGVEWLLGALSGTAGQENRENDVTK
jgi:hypothetical protein